MNYLVHFHRNFRILYFVVEFILILHWRRLSLNCKEEEWRRIAKIYLNQIILIFRSNINFIALPKIVLQLEREESTRENFLETFCIFLAFVFGES